jgi:hypothetical protein
MTNAAFKASFSDWKLIRGRKVVQIVLEVPLEAADEAYNVLGGMPNPASEIWCAVARLNPERKEDKPQPAAPARAKRDWDELSYPQQSGILCNESAFWKFLDEVEGLSTSGPETAAEAIRELCGILSRSELGTNQKAGKIWSRLVSSYRVWQQHPELAA